MRSLLGIVLRKAISAYHWPSNIKPIKHLRPDINIERMLMKIKCRWGSLSRPIIAACRRSSDASTSPLLSLYVAWRKLWRISLNAGSLVDLFDNSFKKLIEFILRRWAGADFVKFTPSVNENGDISSMKKIPTICEWRWYWGADAMISYFVTLIEHAENDK